MGISQGCRGKRGKEPGVKNAPDLILAAEFRREHPVGPAFREDLIEIHIFLDTDVITHGDQPVNVVSQGRTRRLLKIA
jgi:hypothetical protein